MFLSINLVIFWYCQTKTNLIKFHTHCVFEIFLFIMFICFFSETLETNFLGICSVIRPPGTSHVSHLQTQQVMFAPNMKIGMLCFTLFPLPSNTNEPNRYLSKNPSDMCIGEEGLDSRSIQLSKLHFSGYFCNFFFPTKDTKKTKLRGLPLPLYSYLMMSLMNNSFSVCKAYPPTQSELLSAIIQQDAR